jgi:hypothetical protein
VVRFDNWRFTAGSETRVVKKLTDDKRQRVNASSSKGIDENKHLERDVIGCHNLGNAGGRHQEDAEHEHRLPA